MPLTITFKCPEDYHRMVRIAGDWQHTGAFSEVTGDGSSLLTVTGADEYLRSFEKRLKKCQDLFIVQWLKV